VFVINVLKTLVKTHRISVFCALKQKHLLNDTFLMGIMIVFCFTLYQKLRNLSNQQFKTESLNLKEKIYMKRA
jgi:hypothetical protein